MACLNHIATWKQIWNHIFQLQWIILLFNPLHKLDLAPNFQVQNSAGLLFSQYTAHSGYDLTRSDILITVRFCKLLGSRNKSILPHVYFSPFTWNVSVMNHICYSFYRALNCVYRVSPRCWPQWHNLTTLLWRKIAFNWKGEGLL